MILGMHIAEGFLPPVQALVWTLISLPFVVLGFRSIKAKLDQRPEDKVMVASSGAFSFVLSALKVPSVTGSTSHATGVGLGTVLFGPSVMAAIGTIVLIFQALLLAHGGLTTLGANVFSMAVVGPWVCWLVYRGLASAGLSMSVAGGIGAGIGNLVTYCVTALQLAIAHPDTSSGVTGSAVKFLAIFAPTQVPLSVIEGLLTAFVLKWLSTRSTVDVSALTGQQGERRFGFGYGLTVLAAVALITVAPLVARGGAEYAGADSLATEEVGAVNPDYTPWFDGWWAPPSGEVESFLFALQAALGAGLIGYVVGAKRRDAADDDALQRSSNPELV